MISRVKRRTHQTDELSKHQNSRHQESSPTKVTGDKHWQEIGVKLSRTKRRPFTKMISSNRLKILLLISAGLVLICARLGQTQSVTKFQPAAQLDERNAQPTHIASASKRLQSTGQMGHRKHNQLRLSKRSSESADELEAPETSAVATRPTNSDELEMVPTNLAAAALPISSRPAQTKLHIVRLLAPDSIQNGSQDVTIDCMFKYDKKLDRRLAVKWFFNDELEPIYEWIPELNKRVFSDKYERFIDKHYQVTDDVDFMLQAYKWLTTSGAHTNALDQDWVRAPIGDNLSSLQSAPSLPSLSLPPIDGQQAADEQQVAATRRLLAGKLSKLAKLGGDHSRQLISSLRTALAMQDDEVSKFRALRLVRPSTELDGRFTCSVSSLDGDDLKSTRLIVYEPPKSFTFNVSKGIGQTYNLSCRAGPTFPRPSIALYRYRTEVSPQQQRQSGETARHAHRPKLAAAASSLRQELLPGTQVQVTVSAKRQQQQRAQIMADIQTAPEANAIADGLTRVGNLNLDDELVENSLQPLASEEANGQRTPAGSFEVSAWALVDETTLSSNVVTQFECVLVLEGANYEQRQSLALQKGWHVNSYALTAKSTLVGLMSVLASLLCLTVAFVSALLIFKLLRRHANKSTRIHQQVSTQKRDSGGRGQSNGGCESNSSSPSTTPSDDSTTATVAPASGSDTGLGPQHKRSLEHDQDQDQDQANVMRSQYNKLSQGFALGLQPTSRGQPIPSSRHMQQPTQNINYQQQQQQHLSDGIYRVPENRSSFGTRYVAAAAPVCGQQQLWSERGMLLTTNQLAAANGNGQETHHRSQPPATISVNGKQLYC